MGNTEAVYKQVSTKDENVSEDLMFVFHSTDDDCSERVIHDNVDSGKETMLTFTIKMNGRLLAERRCDLLSYTTNIHELRPGDAIEVLRPGLKFHWILYTGNNLCFYLMNQEIIEQNIETVCAGCRCQNVNWVYNVDCLPLTQIMINAKSQLGKNYTWKNSECFVMWCKSGMSEFKHHASVGVTSQKNDSNVFTLEICGESGIPTTNKFKTLHSLIEFQHERAIQCIKKQ